MNDVPVPESIGHDLLDRARAVEDCPQPRRGGQKVLVQGRSTPAGKDDIGLLEQSQMLLDRGAGVLRRVDVDELSDIVPLGLSIDLLECIRVQNIETLEHSSIYPLRSPALKA